MKATPEGRVSSVSQSPIVIRTRWSWLRRVYGTKVTRLTPRDLAARPKGLTRLKGRVRGRQKSAEVKVAVAYAANGPNKESRTGAKHSMREGDVGKRAEMPARPKEAGAGSADGHGVDCQARTACRENARDENSKLMEEVLRRENVTAAYERVVRNGGAPGVDGMTVDALMGYCREHWARIREELLSGTYIPNPVRKVEIPKPGGKGTRMLGIPIPAANYTSVQESALGNGQDHAADPSARRPGADGRTSEATERATIRDGSASRRQPCGRSTRLDGPLASGES